MRRVSKAFYALFAVICFSVSVYAYGEAGKEDGKGDDKGNMGKLADKLKAMYGEWVQKVLNEGKVELTDQFLAKDYIEHEREMPGSPKDPIERFKYMLTTYRTAFPDMKATVEDVLVAGDRLVGRVVVVGTNSGPMMGMPATGKKVTIVFHDFLRFKDGKAVEHWGVGDEVGMLLQMGLLPTPEGTPLEVKEMPEPDAPKDDGKVEPEAAAALVRRMMEEGFNKKDMKAVQETLSDTFVVHNPANPPGLEPGPAGMWKMVEMYHGAFPDAAIKIQDIFVDGNKVAVRWGASGTHSGEFMGVPPTNKKIQILGISIMRVADGKIQEEWELFDQLGMMMQLGLIPGMQ